jgi:hypothetical protein
MTTTTCTVPTVRRLSATPLKMVSMHFVNLLWFTAVCIQCLIYQVRLSWPNKYFECSGMLYHVGVTVSDVSKDASVFTFRVKLS